jgi:uncharacterized damage-inducible protein DinB
MNAQELINQFRFNQMMLTRLLADVSQDDSLRPPHAGVNCINWMLGHLLATRGELLQELGADHEWRTRLLKVYNDKQENFRDSPFQISELKELLEASLANLIATLRAFEPKLKEHAESFPHLLPEGGNWADRVGAFICHEAYHIGQIGLARRLIGKPGLF